MDTPRQPVEMTVHPVGATRQRTLRPFGMRDKIGYMFGDFGNDFSFILQLMFFMVFYTNVIGINPAHVGTMFFIVRIIDGFTDVAVGRFVDTRKPAAAGKFRPWIVRGAVPVAIASALMYVTFIQDWSYPAKLTWMTASYLLWGSICYTFINIPYGSMASVISGKPEDRAALSVYRSTGAQLAIIVIQVALPLIVYATVDGKSVLDGNRLMWSAIVMGLFAILFYLLCYANVQERVIVPAAAPGERASFGKMLGSVLTNRSLLGLIVAAWLLLIGNLLASTMVPYLWLDYFNRGQLQSVAGFAGLVPPLILIVLAPWLARRFGKRETAVVSTLLTGALNIVIFFLALQQQPYVFIVLFALAQFTLAIFNFLVWAFIVDVIDAQEIRSGERDDATVYALYSWARKLGQAVAGGLGGWALGWIGYQKAEQGAPPVQQTQEVLQGIYLVGTLAPGIVFILVALALQFLYPLSKKAVEQNATELAARRAATSAVATD